ncbi:MAG: threonine-phosphate decarboxylase [Alphaproteobacteria bacterium]|nr:threonine-phosphate decarboxylase [Alphaproteobacteria bacterium]MDE2112699.1 threonine-phosphate decarboxylase [Alphaproteobacteria bacterium]MDE2494730.1 threonine-phosphate decarboxylase [Alphaproteobacteria bacterium]
MLEHGGRLRTAAECYGIPLEQWLDLSTGINPNGWPVPALQHDLWSRLPEENDGLNAAAQAYYGTVPLLPVAGSQAAIQALPFLRAPCRVSVIAPGYAEHADAWMRHGHHVTPVAAEGLDAVVAQSDVLLLIQPNNPTGSLVPRSQLQAWRAELAARGGWLVVDEAFVDATPEQSLMSVMPQPGLIILRSLGKFFGLAGLRVGFVSATPALLSALRTRLGPWSIATASRWIATTALCDRGWQMRARHELSPRAARLGALLNDCGLTPSGGTALFQWVRTERARPIHQHLANRAILTRLFETPPSLRFGLPGTDADWHRLQMALDEVP